MKRLLPAITLLLLPIVCDAQSDSLKTAYKQVTTTLKEYKFLSQDASDNNGTTKSITLVVRNGEFEFSFVDDFSPYNDSFFGNKPGTKKVKVPVMEAKFYNSWYNLSIEGENGVEFNYKGKKDLLKSYKIKGEELSLKKLHKELTALQEIIPREKFKGSLGIGSTPTKKSSNKTTSEQKTSDNSSVQQQKRPRNRIPSGN